MRKITVRDRQTLFDIALQYCGDREAVFEIAKLNDFPVTAELSAGTEVTVPEVINQRVVNYYEINRIVPATATGTEIETAENGLMTNDGQYAIVTNNDINIQIVTNNV